MTKVKTIAFAAIVGLAGCQQQADIASHNLSVAADNFEIMRRIVFYNGITDTYMLEVVGLCSIGNNDKPGSVSITCKTGSAAYKKHFLGLSDNVTYFAEQLEVADVSTYHYRVTFRPQSIVPDVDFQGSMQELLE